MNFKITHAMHIYFLYTIDIYIFLSYMKLILSKEQTTSYETLYILFHIVAGFNLGTCTP